MQRNPTKKATIIVNTGTPASLAKADIRAYLEEFLSDPMLIKLPRWLWLPILHGIILPNRPAKIAKAYAKIWNNELNESPLLTTTRLQAEKLAVEFAFRYGQHGIQEKIEHLTATGITEITILPLFPQFSYTTFGSIEKKVSEILGQMENPPRVKFVSSYHNNPLYISAIENSIKSHLDSLKWSADAILATFHGLPAKYCQKGDPYQQQCDETVKLLRKKLGKKHQLIQGYHSKFGFGKWLQPYTEEYLKTLPSTGISSLAIVAPGFSADCLETLEELGMRAKAVFLAHGGKNFTFIPCLNSSDAHIKLLNKLIS